MEKTVSGKERQILGNKKLKNYIRRHPYIAFFTLIVGAPIALLTAVVICTAVITFPLALVFGWL